MKIFIPYLTRAEFLLIQKMKHGDENAFNIFIHTYYEEILKYCSYHCSDIFYHDGYAEEQISLQKTETENVLDKVTIQAALNDLPEELREVIILYYFQELRLAEISDMLGIGLPLVKYRIKQARIQLKRLLGEE